MAEHLGIAWFATVARAARLDRDALGIEAVDPHVAPATASLPLVRQVGARIQRARCPWDMRGWARPAGAQTARLVERRARLACLEHLLPVLVGVGPTLPKRRVLWLVEGTKPALLMGVMLCYVMLRAIAEGLRIRVCVIQW